MIQSLNLSPLEIESVVSAVDLNHKKAQNAVLSVMQSQEDITSVLQRIASGQAFSKQNESLCLMTALKKECPYFNRRQCVYEIATKSTLYALISEYNRMYQLCISAETPSEKNKYKTLLQSIVLPNLGEMLSYLRDNYGEDVFHEYEQLIKENTT